MIDLASAYRQIAAILAKHGLRCSYTVSIQVWHHEVGEMPVIPSVTYTAGVIYGARCIQASDCATLADALAGVETKLGAYLAESGQVPTTLPDLAVAVPVRS